MLWRVPELVLLAGLFATLGLSLRLGILVGAWRAQRESDRAYSQLTTQQGAMLGLLALMLGFSFSMATARWDLRKHAAIDEANAIGTAYLRTALLPEPQRGEIRTLFVAYVDARLSRDATSPDSAERARAGAESQRLQRRIWDLAVVAAFADPRPTTSGLFVEALNTMIDAQGTRVALGEDRVPGVILWLLIVVAVGSLALTGYASGIVLQPRHGAGLLVALLVSLVILLVVDLDRPSRGAIRVSDASLRALQATMQGAP